jgi:hypothetical protein
VALEIDSTDRRMTFTITWPKVLAVIGTLVVGMLSATFYLGEMVFSGFERSVSELRADTGERFSGREEEDRDIRSALQESSDKLRADIKDLGDRLVASNAEVGEKIEGLRGSLLLAVERADGRTEKRFDRLEEKLDKLIRDIAFPIEKNRYFGPNIDESMPAAPETVNDPR